MARKFPLANVQQAFILDSVRELGNKDSLIFSVGNFEDSAYWGLKRLGYNVGGLDPETDISLELYVKLSSIGLYDIVFSTSVIEHVIEDEVFLDGICKLIKPGGYGLLTMDYNNSYRPGDRLPYTDVRFYTEQDLLGRLNQVLINNNCALLGTYSWTDNPDFDYDGCKYSFATYTFYKVKNG